jgi:hypothetical protein
LCVGIQPKIGTPYQIESQAENAALARRSKNVGLWL